jgi:sugar phosphate isomerase/epimerase
VTTRRAFARQAGLFASAALAAPDVLAQARHKMGLQLFTIRDALRRDVAGTLKSIAAMGYQEVETYGFDPDGIGYYRLPAKEFAQLLRDNGLTSPSGHYDLNTFVKSSLDDLNRYVDRCVLGAQALGQSYITWPVLDAPHRTLETFKVVAERLNGIGERVAKAGLQVAYHNHGYEFVEQDGQLPYDIILKNTDPKLVKLQVDLYWLAHDSKQPAHYWFQRAPGRFVMWHVKDMHRVSRDYTELGNGTIDYTKIWPDIGLAGMKHFFVEQGGNFAHDSMRSVADCAEYVKRVLLR